MEDSSPGSSSPFPLRPVSAAVLAEQETERRNRACALGLCTTGCRSLDDDVLLGGLERGSIVGISADEGYGETLGFQILAQHVLAHPTTTALLVTTQPSSTVLPLVRDALSPQTLDRVLLARIFDLDGLYSVLCDDTTASLILVTHVAGLIAGAFTQRGAQAHGLLALLRQKVRYVAHGESKPMVVLLNATGDEGGKKLDGSLQSVFEPPRRKSAFGQVFAQLVEVHLMVWARAEGVVVVEVLMDEKGVWEGRTGRRPSREQRWTAVRVVRGRVVDGFEKEVVPRPLVREIRTSGGFGGRRP